VATVYGWWQACQLSKLSGYDPFSEDGANANLLIDNSDVDPISASVAHRSQRCRIRKISDYPPAKKEQTLDTRTDRTQ
jgi:hypothetical protein